jgi:hypothetical protein
VRTQGHNAPTRALGDVLARELEVAAAKVRAQLAVHLEGVAQLRQDVVELARLQADVRHARVACVVQTA